MSGKLLNEYSIVEQYSHLFDRLKTTPQDPVHHGEGDVYTHTQMVLDALLNMEEYRQLNAFDKQVLEYTALFHNIAKPHTLTYDENGRIRNPRHATMGANLVRQILDRENFKLSFILAVHYAVLFHGYPFHAFEQENPLRNIITTSLLTNNKLLYIFAKADLLGRVCGDAHEMQYKLDLFRELCLENNCWDRPKEFASDYDRFYYFNVNDSYPDTRLYHQYAFDIYLLSGLPASGKDAYIEYRWNNELPVISLDDIREELDISPTGNQGRVIQRAKEQSKEYSRQKQSFVWNATNISRNMRNSLITMWLPYQPKIHIIFIYKPINKTLEDNRQREKEYKISTDKILAMHEKVQFPTMLECHHLDMIVHK